MLVYMNCDKAKKFEVKVAAGKNERTLQLQVDTYDGLKLTLTYQQAVTVAQSLLVYTGHGTLPPKKQAEPEPWDQ